MEHFEEWSMSYVRKERRKIKGFYAHQLQWTKDEIQNFENALKRIRFVKEHKYPVVNRPVWFDEILKERVEYRGYQSLERLKHVDEFWTKDISDLRAN